MSKRKLENEELDSNEDETEDSSSSYDDDEDEDVSDDKFEVEFDLFNQKESDFHSLKVLCKDMFDVPFNYSDLADLVFLCFYAFLQIIASPVGSTVKNGSEDEEPFGYLFVSLIFFLE